MSVDVDRSWQVAKQRRRLVVEYIETKEWVTVRELTEEFQISETTARRDLGELAKQHHVVRVHGGAGRARV